MVTGPPYLLAAVLAITLVLLFVLREKSTLVKLAGEFLLLVLIGWCLFLKGSSPLPGLPLSTLDPDAGWLRALAVIWWLIGARVVAVLTVLVLQRDPQSKGVGLVADLLAGGIYVSATLIILNSVLDLKVNALLATSGVIAIVLGLALQNTLADVFSGIAVGIEKPFHVGDRVSIGNHPEGTVIQMNWRAIRIRTDGDDLAMIPNSIVARSEIINRSVPTTMRAASVDIPTLSTARSETLLGLVNQALLLSPAVLARPAPSAFIKHIGTRFTTLGVGYHVASTADLAVAKGQLLRQVRRLFRHAGVLTGEPLTTEALLAGLILFEALTPEQVAGLAQALIPHTCDSGTDLFLQGGHGASLYVVRSGVFEIARKDAHGVPKVYGRIGAGEYLGEVSMMTGEPYPVTVSAISDASVVELPRSAIEALLGQDSRLSAALERSVKRGLALLDRDDAARNCQPLDDGGTMLSRMRSFLHRAKR